ncbi:MAG: hypothetical protein ABS942_06225 [Solibacillus sp.]
MKKIVISFVAVALGMLLSSLLTNEKDSTENGYDELVTVSTSEDTSSEILVINEIGKHFTIPIASIPQLATYLETAPDAKMELARIHYEFLSGDSDHFVLKYGCGNKRCHLLLVEVIDSGAVTTVELGEGIYASAEVFQQQAMFLIAENEGNEVVRHKIMLVDLHTLKNIYPKDQLLTELYFVDARYPITKLEWLSETSIRLEVADIDEASYEAVASWYKEEDAAVVVVEIAL